MLEARNLGYQTPRGTWILRGVDLEVQPGEFLAVLGPNGSGKTTLLRLLSGEVSPSEGEVRFLGERVRHLPPEVLAQRRAVLSQTRGLAFPFTAYEVAFLGRLPHLKGREGPEDHAKTERALERARALGFAERLFPSLSGGEGARVEVARLLAQEPKVFLLDEPTNHLDPRYALELLALFRALTYEGCAVLAVLHDLNLAALFADRALLLKGGRPLAQGPVPEVLKPELLEAAYEVAFLALGRPGGPPFFLPYPKEVVHGT